MICHDFNDKNLRWHLIVGLKLHEFVSLSIKTAENSSWPRDIKDKVTWPKIEIIWFVTICSREKRKKKTMLYIFELWNQIKTIDKGYLWQKMPNISKWWWPYGITVPLLVIQIVGFQAGTTEIKFSFQNISFIYFRQNMYTKI